MKTSTLIMIGMICLLSVFTTLYFVKPRVVIEEKIITKLIDKIPEKTEIIFRPEPPDTIYNIQNSIVSKKTFKECLLKENEKPVIDLESEITAYAKCPVDSFGNIVKITIDKSELKKSIEKDLPPRENNLGKGLLYGSAGTIILGGILYVIFR